MSQQIIKGVFSATAADSAGRTYGIVTPLDGSLAGFVYGMPSARKGGPEVGTVVEILAIPGSLDRNFTYLAHKAAPVADLWGTATVAVTGQRTQAVKQLSATERTAKAKLRAAHNAALSAAADAENTQEVPSFG